MQEYYGENVLHMSAVAEDPSVVKVGVLVYRIYKWHANILVPILQTLPTISLLTSSSLSMPPPPFFYLQALQCFVTMK